MKHFDIKNAALYIGGYTITSFATGEAVGYEPSGENFTLTNGTNKELVRVANANNWGTLKVRLNLGNDANQYLSQLEKQDRTDGTGIVSVRFVDYNGNGEVRSDSGFVKQHVNLSWGTDEAVREWEIILANPDVTDSKLVEM